MNYLHKLVKNIKYKQRKRKIDSIKRFVVFTVLGAAIGGVVTVLLDQNCCEETKNVIIKDEKDVEEDINRDEIKQTLEKVGDESIGNVGVAIEKALEDLGDEK